MLKYVLLYVFLLFAIAFEDIIPGFNYWDELITIIIFFYSIRKKNFRLREKEFLQWICLILLILIGVVGNVLHPGIQKSNTIIFKDIFAISKFFIICFSLNNIEFTPHKREKIVKTLATASRCIVAATFLIAVIGYAVDIGVYTGEIRVVKCFQFIFQHPTFFVSSYVMLAAAMISESSKKNMVFLILDSILLFLSQRTKGYVVILAIFAIIIIGDNKIIRFLNKALDKNKFTLPKFKSRGLMLLMVIVVYFLGRNKIIEYIGYGLTATRPALYAIGVRILIDYFPFGTGFGTFASVLSTEVYSKIYSMYGIENVLGLVEGDAVFAGDVFWPCIYGQLGILGICLYLKMIWEIIKGELFEANRGKTKLALLVMWLYVFIASTAEAYFTNSSGVQFALVSILFIRMSTKKKKGNIMP